MRFVFDLDTGAVRRQHPNRNLQSTSASFHDSDCAITSLRSADDTKGLAVQRVKGIGNLNVTRFRTQGIVGAGVSTRTCIAWFLLAASALTVPDGYVAGSSTSFR
jgi:hypothetical protein